VRAAVNIFTGIVWALWASLIWLGIDGIRRVMAQHVPGYPTYAQIFYYFGIPAAVAIVLLLSAIALNYGKRSEIPLATLSGLALLLLPFYIFIYGGGV
jgi:hypothetical protein